MCKTEQNLDGTSTAMYLFHLLSSSLIMKPRNSISSNIPAFKAIRIDEIIIKKMSSVEKTFTCARPMIRKIVTTKAGNKTDKLTPTLTGKMNPEVFF